MNEDQESRLLNDWLEGKANDEAVRDELSDEALLKYKQILETVDQWVPDNDAQIFDPRNITQKPKTIVRELNWWKPLSIAASVLLVLSVGLFYFFNNDQEEFKTLANERQTILLPDQTTTVELAGGSTLTYDRSDWEEGKRKVRLEGQAYFDVTAKGAFEVTTSLGNVSVLGTQFNVKQTGEFFVVSCYEGKVKAEAGKINTEVIAGQMTRLTDGKWESPSSITDKTPAWLSNLLKFNNAPLKEVIQAVAMTFSLTIDYSGIDTNRRFTGTIPDDNLDVALQIVFDPMGIKYTLKGKQLILSE